jgi:3D (Asp-Asp-Asp) domain-containing protein
MVNRLNTDLIHPGDLLTIAPEKHHTVIPGDTLWDISMDHQVTVSQIKEWNNLNTDLIHPGLNLLIFDGLKTTNHALTVKLEKHSFHTESIHTESMHTESINPEAHAPKESAPVVKAEATSNSSSKEITVKATAYTASCGGCSGITATGINIKAHPNEKVIAVDPSVIPLGSKVYVEGYGEAIAGDTGGAIKGNRIDIFIPSEQEAINFGVKHLKVTILK